MNVNSNEPSFYPCSVKRYNNDKCRCECNKLIDNEISDKGFI